MATFAAHCPDCGRPINVKVGVSARGLGGEPGEVNWWEDWHCPHCGYRVHSDDGDTPSNAARSAVLAAEGEWVLRVGLNSGARAGALAALRRILGLSMTEVAAVRARLPGPVARGALAEMECLRWRLEREGIACTMERAAQE